MMGSNDNGSRKFIDSFKEFVWWVKLFLPSFSLYAVFMYLLPYFKKQMNTLALIMSIIIVFLIGIIISYCIWNRISHRSYRYPWKIINRGYNFQIEKKEISYALNGNTVDYSRAVRIKSLVNNLTYIHDKYIWTGAIGSELEIEAGDGIQSINHMVRNGIFQYIQLNLLNSVKKGECADLDYSWKPIPDYKKSSPFFSASTEITTKELVLNINLGRAYKNQLIYCQEYRSLDSDIILSQEEHRLNYLGQFSWTVPNIKRYRLYRVIWNWEIGRDPVELVGEPTEQ